MGTFCVYSSDFSGVLCTHRSLPGAVTAIFEVYGTVRSTVGSFFCALLTLLDITLGSEVVRVARQDRVAHISKQSSEPFRSYWKCRSQIESVLVLSISFG
jgi:hypothetical protein